MKPLSLEISGIGPFVDTQRIDFTLMDEKSLFLISGPTGVGKTFIFDALCYALYAESATGRESHLKSDFLSRDAEPRIELSFALGDKSYRVRRGLAYRRAKKRGEGFTQVPESQGLFRFNPADGRLEPLASKKSDVNRILNGLLGLDARQFRQVVMIPQGEFRKLLLSDSGDREILLERLFDTQLYRDIQVRLKEMEEVVNQAEQSRFAQLEQLKESITKLWREEDLVPSLTDTADFSNCLTEAAAMLREKVDNLVSLVEKAASARDKAVSDLVRAENLHAEYRQLRELEEQTHILNQQQEAMNQLKTKLENDRRTLALSDRYSEILRLRQTAEAAMKEYQEAVLQLEMARKSKTELDEYGAMEGKWREDLDRYRRRIKLFSGFENEEARRRALRDAMEEAVDRQKNTRAAREKLSSRTDEIARRRSDLEEEIRNLEDGGSAEEKRSRIASWESFLAQEDESRVLAHRIKDADELVAKRSRIRDAAAMNRERLKALREANLAGELAAALEDRMPCPVCGSIHHPHPHPVGIGPKAQEIAEAEHVLSDADSSHANARSQLLALQGQQKKLDEKRSNLTRDLNFAPTPHDIRSLSDELDREKTLREERERVLEVDLAELNQKKVGIIGEIERTGEEIRSLGKQLEEREIHWNAALAQWPSDDGDLAPSPADLPGSLKRWEDEIQNIEKRLEKLTKDRGDVMEHLKSCETAEKLRRDQKKKAESLKISKESAFLSEMTSSGFPDEEAFRKAVDAAANSENDKMALSTWEKERGECATLMADTIKRINGRPNPNISDYRAVRDKALEDDAQAANSLRQVRTVLSRIESLTIEYTRLEDEARESWKRSALLRRLSRQARGVLPPKISLNRFFLARRLEEVLIQATRRLTLLSRGRFTLKRRDEGRSVAAQAGLDLLITDAWSGTERPVNTLSGGQLFMASLSLALGLADVVQARSGGVRLEALFIDEGFGTLDDEALQEVLTVLNDLRENRMVGIISHVMELKRQIANRIEISPAEVGSKLRLIRGD